MKKAKLLLVEDDKDFQALINDWAAQQEFELDSSDCAAEAFQFLAISEYDALIFDWNLPDYSGVELCKKYRAGGGKSPVLMLTAESFSDNIVTGLEAGADDYVTKPVDPQVLTARVRALLRRGHFVADKITLGDTTLDLNSMALVKGGRTIELRAKEFAILKLLMSSPGRIYSAAEILARVWSADEEASATALRIQITRLRKALADASGQCSLENVFGMGYRMNEQIRE